MLDRVDHIVIAVADLAAAQRTAIDLLGRSPSWSGAHPQFGTRNVIFRLDNTYVELLSPEAEGGVADGLRKHLVEHGDGLYAIALGTEDVDAAAGELRARGLAPSEPVTGLAQDEPSGAFRRFKNVFLPPTDTRGIRLFLIEHLSSRDELPPSLPLADAKSVVSAVDHVVIMTREPEQAISLYGDKLGIRLALDRTFPERRSRLLFFRLGGLTIEIGSSTAAPAAEDRLAKGDHLWGLALQVPDVDLAHARLVAAGVPVSAVRDGRKRGTRVMSVAGDPLGVPTLMIEPAAS